MLRIATFNVENLFERPKLLNFLDHAKGDVALAKLRSLQNELAKATYDKPAILALWKDLKSYVTVVEARGKLFNSAKTKVQADGSASWDGWLQLKPDDIPPESRANTAKVSKTINAVTSCWSMATTIGASTLDSSAACPSPTCAATSMTGTPREKCSLAIASKPASSCPAARCSGFC